ncbi:hypothetical protein H109_01699 [Trichophyton interdigitale MR816]|uniref:Uncharacterized protein n=1 Tax=Trichophyton interdigitale (strain MR816) TaxID=1215338 RepID=A0A059JFM9_TRIIM|nr:hypothetical protein H101_02574 [Trichophyton interdigitale H6]KDB26493.1 hypothetical protein H109_01699 [Trichophyton interdigitale MR816]
MINMPSMPCPQWSLQLVSLLADNTHAHVVQPRPDTQAPSLAAALLLHSPASSLQPPKRRHTMNNSGTFNTEYGELRNNSNTKIITQANEAKLKLEAEPALNPIRLSLPRA